MKTKSPAKNKKRTVTALTLIAPVFVLAIFASVGEAASISKDNNTDDLNLGSSWVGGTVPGASDVAVWNGTVTSANSTLLGADLSWAGIQVDSTAGGNVTIGGATDTLTLGASGISVSTNRTLTLSSLVELDADQTWTGPVTVNGTTMANNGNTLTLNGQITLATDLTGTGGIIKDGSATVNITGHSTYTGTTTIKAGIFQLTGASSSIASASEVTGTGGQIRFFWSGAAPRTFANTISGSINLQKFTTTNIVELTGANSYTGKTTISGGGLSVSSLNSVGTNRSATSSLGAPVTVANGTIDVGLTSAATSAGTGTLIYTGSGETTDRVINLSGMNHGAVLDQSGTGLLKFTSDFTATGKGSKTLTLQGSTAAAGEIFGAIVNNGTSGNTTLVTAFTAGKSTITLGSVDGISVGASISGTGIASGTTVTAIDAGTRTVTLSANTTGTGAFGNTITVDGVVNLTSVIKDGSGTWTLSGQNTYTGSTTVSVGTLALESGSGSALGATATITINSNATLLIAKGDQINDSASITLSGGTIQRASGVSETMGDLTLTADSTLNYGSGTEGTLTFGTYTLTPSSLLTVNNFFEGNKLVFASDLRSIISNSSYFAFDNGITSSWDGSTFTITAIPEVSTMAAAAGLLGLLLCPMLRRRTLPI